MKERVINCELAIEAEIDTVWQALTEAEHIQQWFAPYAETSPGVGGHISLSWSDPAAPHKLEIVGWEAGRLLETRWFAAPQGQDPINLPLRVELTSLESGRTLLSLTQSGFLSDASWDDEFESHSRGWNIELRSLRYYLEAQLGRTREFFLERMPVDLATMSFEMLVGVDGLLPIDPQTLKEGERFNLQAAGESWRCQMIWQLAAKDFVFICDALDGGLVRIGLENIGTTPELWFWAFSWQLSEEELRRRITPLIQQFRERV